MSTGMFYLDEEPEQTPTAPTTSAVGDHGSSMPSRPPSPTSPASTSPTAAKDAPATRATPSSLQLPQSLPPGHRRQIASFAATPSFPSPLAQAIVPLNSDTSSSSSHSSDEERDAGTGQDSPVSAGSGTPKLRAGMTERPRTVSPNPSRTSGSRAGSPSSTEKSISRPPSPSMSRPQPMLTPGSLLNRARRSTSGTLVPPTLSGSLPNPSPLRDSPPRAKNLSAPTRRMGDLTRSKSKGHGRERSGSSASSVAQSSAISTGGSSPGATYSPELFPADSSTRSAAGSPTDTRENTLGLGLGWGGWDASSASGSSYGGSIVGSAGGRGQGSEQGESRTPRSQVGVGSPPRQRRPSEFLNTATSGKAILGGRQSLGTLPVANLSTSASMISPLNPLPSPWTSSSSNSSAFGSPNQPEASSAASGSGGAMRLNRVPTSVKLATELMKSQSMTSSSSPAASSSESPQFHSSLPSQGSKRELSPSRSIGHSSSMPPPPTPHPPSALDLGKGRPTLSVPSTPAPHLTTTVLATPASIASHPSTSSSTSSHTQSRPRPSLPPEAESSGSLLSVGARHNRYRTSMHESISKPLILEEYTKSPPLWTPPAGESATLGRSSSPYGLGLNLPSNKLLQPPANVSGSMTPVGGLPSGRPRIRSTTDKTLQMDLAGLAQLGDAASHANMIMQSRQAKLQRWRPNSAGQMGENNPAPPPFKRSTTSSTPAMLAAPRADRQAAWNVQETARASSFGEDLPNFPAAMGGVSESSDLPFDSPQLESSAAPLRSAVALLQGGMGMERESSAGGTIGGIEWVDWYDCYKRYKDQKIRAEAQAVRSTNRIPEDRPLEQSDLSAMTSTANSPSISTRDDARRSLGSGGGSRDMGISGDDGDSAIALTPTTSRDDHSGVSQRAFNENRRRSLSLRSSLDLKSAQRKSSIFERPRQASGGSTRSTDTGNAAAVKRKKNLVHKMEGWWSAVKSNFIPESQFPPPYRSSNLAKDRSRRGPSAPGSRRGSETSPISSPTTALPVPEPIRELSPDPRPTLRNVSSHAEFRPKADRTDSPLMVSTSADIARIARKSVVAPPPPRDRLAPPEEEAPSRASLDSRRRQPMLRLDLDSNVLSRPPARIPADASRSGSSVEQRTQRPSEQTSRSSSYGPLYGPGLTPGVPKWNQTPSPIVPVDSMADSEQLENRPVAPGAELTVASVRRHVKRRLNAAKEVCDDMLREMIASITTFAEEQKSTVERPFEDSEDYFESISDSPLVDAEESDGEFGDAFDGLGPRTVSSSRGPSRRPSISRPAGTSPTRRMSMLPSSPSRPRRRTSTVPKSLGQRDRMIRGFNLADRAHSASSSRSTSRSRSPMPMMRPSDSDRQFLAALQELIVLATDVLESSINQLIAKPTMCSDVIQKIQKVGRKWDDNDSWPGRSWYLSILMEVAKLSQVLDWWGAEKGFWNFDAEEVENEPLVFVMKPQREENRFEEPPRPPSSGGLLSPLAHPHSSPSTSYLQVPDALPELMLEAASPTSPTAMSSLINETPKGQAAENLKILADHAKSVNIVMELSLQGEEVQYINDAIMEVTGRDPDDVLFRPITDILAPADASTFAEATQKLLEDDNNTVQLRVRLELHEAPDDRNQARAPGPVYVELEGVGMLMRELDAPSHTMWVLKPVPATQTETLEAAFPKDGHIAVEGILCRICERDIATWFFEKHNETCDAVHRLEAEITEADECLEDLRRTVLKLNSQIGGAEDEKAQYQGVLFLEWPESLQAGDNGLPVHQQLVERKKVTQQHLVEAADILQAAVQIESPAVRGEETDLPFNLQRYLDPQSEDKLARVTRWQRPATSDHALALLFTHVEEQLRRKHKAIARMQSTIRYSEKTRHEWEDKVNQVLGEQDTSGSDSGSDGVEPADVSIATVIEAAADPGDSPPSHRKIAPQARLPVTLGHSGRPSTSHGESGISTVPPTPLPRSAPSSPALEVPQSAPIVARQPSPTLLKPDRISPHLSPVDGAPRTHARRPSKAFRDMPLSPRIPSAALNRGAPPSIKDFEIIKPISRGAFGSVYLAKKVATGDYFAIKALKKSDMIAKNQITNVKAERTILMNQASSPYVVKLFFSFQSKDYLYLVMEYLNGGDCATLVKTLGGLPEDWARNYIAEVILGLEYLHARNIVHRDIKPDNLLIDSKGHLKLTDFGLSRIGLLNRQVAGPRPAYLRGTSLRTAAQQRPLSVRTNSSNSPAMSPDMMTQARQQGYFSAHDSGSADESSGSESANVIPKHMRQLSKLSSDINTPSITGREPPKVVGTPDYLAPESILGIGNDDRTVDWWALGVVLYEFIYGVPPFHADTPSQVFDNIVSRRIDWHDDEVDISVEARDLMDRLMCSDPEDRLGSRGAEEVKKHAFFAELDWATLCEGEASFIPQVTDPESTDYFDARGAVHGFQDEDAPQVSKAVPSRGNVSPLALAAMEQVAGDIAAQEDFGTFNFKNLPVLKQANDDMIRKLRVDSMVPIGQALDAAISVNPPRRLGGKPRPKRKTSDLAAPPSPTTSTSSAASTPSRSSGAPTTPSTLPPVPTMPQHLRRPSELNALDRVKSSDDGDLTRRSSAPSRIRAGSGSSVVSDRSTSMELWRQRRQVSLQSDPSQTGSGSGSGSFPSNSPFDSPDIRGNITSVTMDRTLDVLIAEDNPISQKILETLLTRMGCRCICVEDGPQALAATMGSIRFDVIICDIHMPVVNGEQVARMIRSTNNHNQNTPIIAATSYEKYQAISEEGTLFSAVLAKPVSKVELTRCLAKLGFELSSNAVQPESVGL